MEEKRTVKRNIVLVVALIALACSGFVLRGIMKASLMQQVSVEGMTLLSDSAENSDWEAKMYELAYSSPLAPNKVGLWLEAVLTGSFETFTTNGKTLSPAFAKKLAGWPMRHVLEVDLSGSGLTDTGFRNLGPLTAAQWIDLSNTEITAETIPLLLARSPNLSRLQLKNTKILWDTSLVDELLKYPNVKQVELVEDKIDQKDLDRMKGELNR